LFSCSCPPPRDYCSGSFHFLFPFCTTYPFPLERETHLRYFFFSASVY
jgi:hypothetical protein